MERKLTETEWAEILKTFHSAFEHTAFRLELQPVYAVGVEQDALQRFLDGDPVPPDRSPAGRAWYDQVALATSEGKHIERVRVHDDPPTPYQRWQRWSSAWSVDAGETIGYMTRAKAHEVGLLPAAGKSDWWLFDSSRLIVLRFDHDGHRTETELVTDPAAVSRTCAWRDLAVHHSTPDDGRGVAF